MNTKSDTKTKILTHTKSLIARESFSGFNMRKLSKNAKITLSLVYHYYPSKEKLFEEVFILAGKDLEAKIDHLPQPQTIEDMLKQRIDFQFEHAEDVVYIMKYYLAFRRDFNEGTLGYIPDLAYKHICDVLDRAEKDPHWDIYDKNNQAKIITHAINGFILEYYPDIPKKEKREDIVNDIHRFMLRCLKKSKS